MLDIQLYTHAIRALSNHAPLILASHHMSLLSPVEKPKRLALHLHLVIEHVHHKSLASAPTIAPTVGVLTGEKTQCFYHL